MSRFLICGLALVFSLNIAIAEDRDKTSLFDGKSLAGWQPIGGSADNWSAGNGVLGCNGKPGATWLATKKEYTDFELELEFNVPENGNSGVFVRAPKGGAPWVEGIEIQILDDNGDKWRGLAGHQYTGAIYAVVEPSERATKKAGQWQSMKIRCVKRSLIVWVNGKKVVESNLDQLKDHYDKVPGLKRNTGLIGLQNHGDQINFRKLFLRDLSN